MEVWALQGFSVAYILQEMLTLKSDDCSGRIAVQKSILFGTKFPLPFIPESFHVTLIELRALCFNLTYKTYHPRTQKKKKKRKIDKNPRVFMLPIVPSLKKINPILKKRAI
jgi:DNA-directed RNA polymerase subunit beta